MHIEHWKCQSQHPELELSYQNILAVCSRNRSNPPHKQHCDTRKGDLDLMYNPADTTHHARLKIHYRKHTGKIESEDTVFCAELGGTARDTEGVLNLNHEQIMNNRRAVIELVEREIGKLPSNASKAHIRPLLDRWLTINSQGMLPAYAGVAMYFIEKRLAKAQ